MSNQSGVQTVIRAASSTALTYEGDWHAYWDSLSTPSIPAGTFNERMGNWIRSAHNYPSAPTDLAGAMQHYAEQKGFNNWSSMNSTLVL